MPELERYFKTILDGLPLIGCLLKEGRIIHVNEAFAAGLDKEHVEKFLREVDDSGTEWPFSTKTALYSLKRIVLDESFSLGLLSKVKDYQLGIDQLTGVFHKESFDRFAGRLLEQAMLSRSVLGFLFIDLDGFKSVNDTFGHDAGDIVLKSVAQRILRIIRADDYCFRLGGDEFVVLLTSIKDKMHSCLVARRLISGVAEPIIVNEGGGTAKVGASIGISCYPNDGEAVRELTARADEAMYKAKKLGKSNYQLYQGGR